MLISLTSRLLENEVGCCNYANLPTAGSIKVFYSIPCSEWALFLAKTVLQGDTCARSGLTSGGGYAPEPSEKDQLMEIDSKIQQLSVKEFVPSQDSSTNLSLSQVRV